MRAAKVSWREIGESLGKRPATCQMQYTRLQQKAAFHGWTPENEMSLKEAYEKRKGEMWRLVAAEMGFDGHWKVLESKVLELGKKGMRN